MQTALVAVKSASINEMPLFVEQGNSKSMHPIKIIDRKLNTNICAGPNCMDMCLLN